MRLWRRRVEASHFGSLVGVAAMAADGFAHQFNSLQVAWSDKWTCGSLSEFAGILSQLCRHELALPGGGNRGV